MAREMIVVPYDPAWVSLYEEEKAVLSLIFRDILLDIEHFGSTAVVGMSAKPIIDILIIVKDLSSVDSCNGAMLRAGYTVRGENGIPGRRYFVRFKEDSVSHSHHVHVYELENEHVKDELMFRDYLSADHEAFAQYERTKLAAAEQYRFSPGEYTDAKSECVRAILEKARAYYSNRL